MERNYILSEYAGPGCPMITEKKVWYTVIAGDKKVSAEVFLGKEADCHDIKSMYDLTKDPDEKCNLRKQVKKHSDLIKLLEQINTRSVYLGKKFSKETFLKDLIGSVNCQD